MAHAYHQIAFTDAVKARQEGVGSRTSYAKAEDGPLVADRLGTAEAAFIAARDSFYIASVGADGWPYMQHRGGPMGFAAALDAETIGWAEFTGNKQYITTGNLDGDDRVSLFFMDYAKRRRLKLFGHARRAPIEDAPALAAPYEGSRLEKRVEGVMLVRVAGVDWNCPQYITPRFSIAELEAMQRGSERT